ncbi:MAG TPA: GAF domain-containing protein [Thermoanaerobaculia bacterium]|nr:GAF domain-containing protein [Thermoanaerobaculia bacterium]
MKRGASLQEWLETFLRDHDGVAGTVHVLSGEGVLELAAAVRIPEKVQEIVRRIPKGKGMAGLAWQRNEPVATCNIQSDENGPVRPGARAIDAQAGLALPVRDARGEVRAVVGIAYREERTFRESEIAGLAAAAASLP